ncbi:hypothetical protein BVC80_1417g20 [Macleaya cordata]|uniref:Uncharacterized protein n=1 Tax=Macleaya cordata TaxID=56857 RepID=A0A200Q5N9_MACCD|nr:hypothetical protein BVC80_1417g20 [Macleaya cordata]
MQCMPCLKYHPSDTMVACRSLKGNNNRCGSADTQFHICIYILGVVLKLLPASFLPHIPRHHSCVSRPVKSRVVLFNGINCKTMMTIDEYHRLTESDFPSSNFRAGWKNIHDAFPAEELDLGEGLRIFLRSRRISRSWFKISFRL